MPKRIFVIEDLNDRLFIRELGVENPIAEVFARGPNETVGDNADFLCELLNKAAN